jgi:hypothetical protein
MQGLRPLALRRIVLLRSKLRQVDATKYQPSFLWLASQQEKPRSFLAKKPASAVILQNVVICFVSGS